ncbi:hypothetical protein [Aureitalea sp. L0-47]|uniref:hypothetical protein n=1 Tax=Aureitalea sp. L0-47 TaxID=2816962 RepID=UPI002238C543|nr:hypothetical protein [Aureitalea sp. L0-47]
MLDNYAINGKQNTARIYARISLGILCSSILILWLYLPRLFDIKRSVAVLTSAFGVLSMITTGFMVFGGHDVVVRVAGAFGAIALLLTFKQLYDAHYRKLFFLGIFSLILFLANYFIYETGLMIENLPLLQKFTFISCMAWFAILNVMLIRRYS